jgi:ABC-2 type transport system ATP-binding protein
MIQIDHISKSFEKQAVLKDLSILVPGKTITCLLGPSGSGKTTLIRLIMGAISPDQGSIRIDGTEVPDRKLLGRIGFMPQGDCLYENLTATQNLAFFGRLYGLDKKELSSRIEKSLSLVGLEKESGKLVKKYSGGMKKRLSLAIAVLGNPDVLILDEPTVGIDPVLRRRIWRQFQQWRDQGKTLLVSTHVMDDVTECDRAIVLSEGRFIADDTVSALISRTSTGKIEDLFFDNTRK